MKIILCLGVGALNEGGWRDPEICKKYPGSQYLPQLASNKDIYSAGEAPSFVPEETLILQEELNETAATLIMQGCHPGVLLCMESPIFAPLFYDRLAALKKIFPFQFLFQGGTDQIYFPSFELSEVKPPLPWEKRIPKACIVISNKHYKAYEGVPGWRESPSWQEAVKAQLHDERYLAIHELQKQNRLDLYGRGWPKSMNVEEVPYGEKITVMRGYQLGLCLENVRMNGYVTEKIIDCILAGVVPVYFGAPDIEQFVPRSCFISAEKFSWPTKDQAWEIIQAGQNFLRSKEAKEFTYARFARRILQRLIQVGTSVCAPTRRSNPTPASLPS